MPSRHTACALCDQLSESESESDSEPAPRKARDPWSDKDKKLAHKVVDAYFQKLSQCESDRLPAEASMQDLREQVRRLVNHRHLLRHPRFPHQREYCGANCDLTWVVDKASADIDPAKKAALIKKRSVTRPLGTNPPRKRSRRRSRRPQTASAPRPLSQPTQDGNVYLSHPFTGQSSTGVDNDEDGDTIIVQRDEPWPVDVFQDTTAPGEAESICPPRTTDLNNANLVERSDAGANTEGYRTLVPDLMLAVSPPLITTPSHSATSVDEAAAAEAENVESQMRSHGRVAASEGQVDLAHSMIPGRNDHANLALAPVPIEESRGSLSDDSDHSNDSADFDDSTDSDNDDGDDGADEDVDASIINIEDPTIQRMTKLHQRFRQYFSPRNLDMMNHAQMGDGGAHNAEHT